MIRMSQKSRFVLLTVLLFIFLLPDFMPCSSQPSTVGVTLCLKTPRGLPLEGAWVKIDGIAYGSGECVTARLTPGTHIVEAMWMYVELVLPPLIVTGPGTVTLTPSNIHLLTIRALGARGQALEGARVKVMKGPVEITKLTDRDGKAEIELPDGDYEIEVMYGPFVKTDSVFLTADTFKEVPSMCSWKS